MPWDEIYKTRQLSQHQIKRKVKLNQKLRILTPYQHHRSQAQIMPRLASGVQAGLLGYASRLDFAKETGILKTMCQTTVCW